MLYNYGRVSPILRRPAPDLNTESLLMQLDATVSQLETQNPKLRTRIKLRPMETQKLSDFLSGWPNFLTSFSTNYKPITNLLKLLRIFRYYYCHQMLSQTAWSNAGELPQVSASQLPLIVS